MRAFFWVLREILRGRSRIEIVSVTQTEEAKKLALPYSSCDRCVQTSQWVVIVTPVALRLEFCGHHFGRFKQDFMAKGYPVIERGKDENHPS